MPTSGPIKYVPLFDNIIHLLDSAEPDIRFVVQIEADVGRSKYARTMDPKFATLC